MREPFRVKVMPFLESPKVSRKQLAKMREGLARHQRKVVSLKACIRYGEKHLR
jgi:hypothetical protein